MNAVKKIKTSDLQAILQQVVHVIRKKVKASPPKHTLPLLETLLFAALLENSPRADADAAFQKVLSSFHDLNEIRVSSVQEIETALGGLGEADWKALRIRDLLHATFEKFFSFDLESLRNKPQDQIDAHFAKMHYLTPFMREYAMHHSIGAHATPVDPATCDLLIWLGLCETGCGAKAAAEHLKTLIKKADSDAMKIGRASCRERV